MMHAYRTEGSYRSAARMTAAELGNGDARRNLGRFKRNWFGKWVRK